MFEKLGLEFMSIEYERENVTKVEYYNNDGERVTITKDYIESFQNYRPHALCAKYLLAIIQQRKEFGW